MTANNIAKRMSDSVFNDGVTKLKTPFDVYKFDCVELIPNTEAFKLRTALLTMQFKRKSCDLYSFSQSGDFLKLPSKEKPKEVHKFIDALKDIKQKIAAYLGKRFNKAISVSCSKYDFGDYLLCHDDCVDDRSVAFIYYLNYDWLNEWGGTLDVYSVDKDFNAVNIEQSINPEFNTMIFFPVGKHTYHQVAENLSYFSRISINGWFHADDLLWEKSNQVVKIPSPFYLPVTLPLTKGLISTVSIEPMFDQPLFKEAIRETFTVDGYIMCEGFLKSTMVVCLSNEIFSNDLEWKIKGPLNKMHYMYLDVDQYPRGILFVANILKTNQMFNFFKECSGLEFSSVTIEVQRWHGGHYMVSGGNDGLDGFNVFSVYLFFSQCFGEMSDNKKDDLHYVFELEETKGPKIACKPKDNTIFMVHRESNMESYVTYCKKVEGHAWTVIVANYLIKEQLDCRVKISKFD